MMRLTIVNPAIKNIPVSNSALLDTTDNGAVNKSDHGWNITYNDTMNIQELNVTAQISRRNACSSSLPRTS